MPLLFWRKKKPLNVPAQYTQVLWLSDGEPGFVFQEQPHAEDSKDIVFSCEAHGIVVRVSNDWQGVHRELWETIDREVDWYLKCRYMKTGSLVPWRSMSPRTPPSSRDLIGLSGIKFSVDVEVVWSSGVSLQQDSFNPFTQRLLELGDGVA